MARIDVEDARTPRRGLSAHEAVVRLDRDGPNTMAEDRGPAWPRLLVGQLTHFFAAMLWVAAGLAYLAGMPALSAAIVGVVILNGLFSFAQEWRADRTGQRLRALLPVSVTVRRDDRRTTVAAAELVVGDRVLLRAGDRVSADLVLLLVNALALDESMLTGESVPSRPAAGEVASAATFVVDGEGEGVVVATAMDTRLAGIARLARGADRPLSPLTRRLHRVVRWVAVLALVTGVGFFALAVTLGTSPTDGFLLAVGVTVALVPEGLLPTVTLSLAVGAQRMARRHALVRHLDSVETLGLTTFVCTDKTGTLTTNRMSVVSVWTPHGEVDVTGAGLSPVGAVAGDPAAVAEAREAAVSAVLCSTGRLVRHGEDWQPVGDPMEVALHVLALRLGAAVPPPRPTAADRFPFDPVRRRMSVHAQGAIHAKGAPDAVLPVCGDLPPDAQEAVDRLSGRGLRVLAVARKDGVADRPASAGDAESGLRLLALVGLEDPPRPDVSAALAACRLAGVRVAMVTGDHPATARAVAVETGLALDDDPPVLEGGALPADEEALGRLLDRDGIVVARVTPEDKLRIARALQQRGHVVAMTGDGVNDGPALRAADIGVAMGASGTEVAREAADLVLLDDHFATIVAAVAQGRAIYTNIRRFLTYHLTDNVAELTPFVVWALSGGRIPLALSVLQVLALDIGTDLLPALALGAEPPDRRTLRGHPPERDLIDGRLLRRVLGVLGPAEAVVEMTAFVVVLTVGGWVWATDPDPSLLAMASGSAFAAVVLGQLANAFACRSESRWAGAVPLRGNPLLLGAVGVELLLLGVMLFWPWLSALLGGAPPDALGWALAAAAVPAVMAADAAHKWWRRR